MNLCMLRLVKLNTSENLNQSRCSIVVLFYFRKPVNVLFDSLFFKSSVKVCVLSQEK